MDFIKEKINENKKEQLANVVEKVWGREEWIVNNPKYCGKKMIIYKSYHCSMHCHKIKEESFYILSGKILIETDFNGIKNKRIMIAGDVIHIKQNEYHRFTGLEHSEVIEFSTHHMDEDSYRTELSGKIDLSKLEI
ncbi:cupin domain-containing protein [Candidatus Babeliales bacterium]|nr:cupin domain-containing protein [Candidatus Babeliales bacterium]